jgi:hypothetical protein
MLRSGAYSAVPECSATEKEQFFSPVHCRRLCDAINKQIADVFASDCPLSQAFHLDFLIADCIDWGAVLLFR